MLETIKVNIVNPVVTRMGSLAGGSLAHFGFTDAEGLGQQLAAALGAVALIGVEAVLRKMWSR